MVEIRAIPVSDAPVSAKSVYVTIDPDALKLPRTESTAAMNFLLLLFLVFFAPLLLFVAWLAVSSCLGNRFRAHLAGFSIRPGLDAYGPSYLRTMAGTSAMSEQIELEDMLTDPGTRRHVEEDD